MKESLRPEYMNKMDESFPGMSDIQYVMGVATLPGSEFESLCFAILRVCMGGPIARLPKRLGVQDVERDGVTYHLFYNSLEGKEAGAANPLVLAKKLGSKDSGKGYKAFFKLACEAHYYALEIVCPTAKYTTLVKVDEHFNHVGIDLDWKGRKITQQEYVQYMTEEVLPVSKMPTVSSKALH